MKEQISPKRYFWIIFISLLTACVRGVTTAAPTKVNLNTVYTQAVGTATPARMNLNTTYTQAGRTAVPAILPGFSGHLNPGDAELITQLPVDSSGSVSFNLTWTTGTLDFSMTQPDGTLITPAYAAAHPELVSYRISRATSATPPMATYTFLDSAPGIWTLHVAPGTLAAAGTDFSAYATLLSVRGLQVSANAYLYHPGEIAMLTANLQDASGGLTEAVILGIFQRSDGVTDTIPFTDQGNGVYTASYNVPATTGLAYMAVTATGIADGIPFTRQELLPLAIVSPDATLTGIYTDQPADPDGNGRYDTLNVQVDVKALRAGRFVVTGDLVVGNQPVSHTATNAALVAGNNTVMLTFSGDVIRSEHLNGPYTLTHLAILDLDQTDLPTDEKDNAWQTAAYNWHDFGVCYSLTTSVKVASFNGIVEGNAGSVAAEPAPNCSNNGYASNTQVILSASAKPGYTFVGWTGDEVTDASSPTITLDRNLNVTALFSEGRMTISGNAGVGGATLSYNEGDNQWTVMADMDGNYSFTVPYNWSGTVTLSFTWEEGYIFTPSSRKYTNVTADMSGEDYACSVPPVPTTMYAIRASGVHLQQSLEELMRPFNGTTEAGELVTREKSAGRLLSQAVYARWANLII